MIAASVALLAACGGAEKRQPDAVSVSIEPLRYFVDRIGGGDFKVNVVVPAGTNPEIYEPTPETLKAVARSAAYLAVGHIEFELAMLKAIERNSPGVRFVTLSDGIAPVESSHYHEDHGHNHTAVDPHVWVAPREVKAMAGNILNTLRQIMPDSAAKYEANYRDFAAALDSMDSVATRTLGAMPVKTVLVQHPALTYLARDYGFTQVSIEHEGKEPSVKHIKELVDVARAAGVKKVFCQREFSPAPAQAVAAEIGGEVVFIDLLSYDWESNIFHIINSLNY